MDLFENLGEIPRPMRERLEVTSGALSRLTAVIKHYDRYVTKRVETDHGTINAQPIVQSEFGRPIYQEPTPAPKPEGDEVSIARAKVDAITALSDQPNPLLEVL